MSPANDLFTVFSFISFVLVCVPFYWHLEAKNAGTCLFMLWVAITTFVLFINSVFWSGNTINHAPIWCDISTRIIIGSSVAIPAASMCIVRRIYLIASQPSAVATTVAEKSRAIIVDSLICVGLPLLEMILQYVVQGHRFDIFEDIGCRPFTYNTPLAYVLVFMPPLLLGLISAVYSVLCIVFFLNHQFQVKAMISADAAASRYFRLVCLSTVNIVLTIPFNTFVIANAALSGTIAPWISWEDTHFGFSRVDRIPAKLWRSHTTLAVPLEVGRWMIVILGLVFFAFFGVSQEARRRYASVLRRITSKLPVQGSHTRTVPGTPSFIQYSYVTPRTSGRPLSEEFSGWLAKEESTSSKAPILRRPPPLVLTPTGVVIRDVITGRNSESASIHDSFLQLSSPK